MALLEHSITSDKLPGCNYLATIIVDTRVHGGGERFQVIHWKEIDLDSRLPQNAYRGDWLYREGFEPVRLVKARTATRTIQLRAWGEALIERGKKDD